MNTNIESLYDYVLQRLAAESYLENMSPSDTTEIRRALLLGTNREGYKTGNPDLNEGYRGYTRMTSSQADEFLSKYRIVHQWSDNPTTGAVPGSRPAAEGDPAFDQLNDEILANTGLSATLIQKLDLSGNPTNEYTLAIRSTEFRTWADGGDRERDGSAADVAVEFLGFALAQQDALERYFAWLKVNKDGSGTPLLPSGSILNVTGYSLGGHLATVFTEIHQNEASIQFGQTVTFNGLGRGSWDGSAGSLKDMVDYFHAVLVDPRVAPDVGDPLREGAIGRTGQPFDAKSVYGDQRYDWAVKAVWLGFGPSFQPVVDEGRTGSAADGRITQVYGYESINNTNVAANSGIHGPALKVGIESQPILEGPFAGFIGTGDFGNGHALILLADALALQRAMDRLDSGIDLARFIGLLPAASNRTTSNGPNANYEADPLENILDGLRRQLLGPGVAKTEFKDGASGFGDITKREGFHSNLGALTESAAFLAIAGKVRLEPASADLGVKARNDFAALASLITLSPVVLAATDGNQGALDATLRTVWG
ncbi:MAG: hypothetical protein IT390_21690, partial [Nitrospira sp.]|nr:hypothetical protein [Nitrospira sp.]